MPLALNFTSELDEELKEAYYCFLDYLPKNQDDALGPEPWNDVVKELKDKPLSSWYTVYVHVFFNCAYNNDPLKGVKQFVETINSALLSELMNDIRRKNIDLIKLSENRTAILRTSFYQIGKIEEKVATFEKAQQKNIQKRDNLLKNYLLIAHIISILEEEAILRTEKVEQWIQKMTTHPPLPPSKEKIRNPGKYKSRLSPIMEETEEEGSHHLIPSMDVFIQMIPYFRTLETLRLDDYDTFSDTIKPVINSILILLDLPQSVDTHNVIMRKLFEKGLLKEQEAIATEEVKSQPGIYS